MTTIISTAVQRSDALRKSQRTIETAKAEGRNLTKGEVAEIEERNDAIAKYDEASRKASEEILGSFLFKERDAVDLLDGERGPDLLTVDEKVGLVNAVRSKTAYATTVPLTSTRLKAPMTTGALDLPPVGDQVVSNPDPKAAVALRDLFIQQTATTPTVRYYTLSEVGASGVDVVAEGGEKPEAEMTYAPVDAEMVKIATRFTVTDELAEDAPFMLKAMTDTVLRGVLVRENKLIVDTIAGTSGILTATGTSAALIDLLATEIAASEAINGQTPTALLIHPTDLAAVRIAKAATAGSYFVDPLSDGPTSIHGVPLVSTVATAAGTAYLVTEGLGVFYTRSTLRVEAGHTGDDFIHNRATIRAEERVLPTVQRPTLITQITLTDE